MGVCPGVEYVDGNRGKIQLRDRAQQIIDFSGLKFKRIMPTDIDGMIEYQSKAFVFYEYKLGDAQMPGGQQRAFEELADTIQRGGRHCVVFLCSHDAEDPNQDIDAANAVVSATYYCGKWRRAAKRQTVRERTEAFIAWVNSSPIEEPD